MKFWTTKGVEWCVRQLKSTATQFFCGPLSQLQCPETPREENWRCRRSYTWKLDNTWSKIMWVQIQPITLHCSSADLPSLSLEQPQAAVLVPAPCSTAAVHRVRPRHPGRPGLLHWLTNEGSHTTRLLCTNVPEAV